MHTKVGLAVVPILRHAVAIMPSPQIEVKSERQKKRTGQNGTPYGISYLLNMYAINEVLAQKNANITNFTQPYN